MINKTNVAYENGEYANILGRDYANSGAPAYIVKCVQHHDKLITALQKIMEMDTYQSTISGAVSTGAFHQVAFNTLEQIGEIGVKTEISDIPPDLPPGTYETVMESVTQTGEAFLVKTKFKG